MTSTTLSTDSVYEEEKCLVKSGKDKKKHIGQKFHRLFYFTLSFTPVLSYPHDTSTPLQVYAQQQGKQERVHKDMIYDKDKAESQKENNTWYHQTKASPSFRPSKNISTKHRTLHRAAFATPPKLI